MGDPLAPEEPDTSTILIITGKKSYIVLIVKTYENIKYKLMGML